MKGVITMKRNRIKTLLSLLLVCLLALQLAACAGAKPAQQAAGDSPDKPAEPTKPAVVPVELKAVNLIKDHPQSTGVAEHIVCVTEHNVVCFCHIKTVVACMADAAVGLVDVPYPKRILPRPIHDGKLPSLVTVIDDKHFKLGKIDSLLQFQRVKQRLYFFGSFLVMRNDDLQ